MNQGKKLIAIEIKLSSEPQFEDVKKLNRYAKLIEATHEIIICRTVKIIEEKNKCYCNLEHALSYLEEALK